MPASIIEESNLIASEEKLGSILTAPSESQFSGRLRSALIRLSVTDRQLGRFIVCARASGGCASESGCELLPIRHHQPFLPNFKRQFASELFLFSAIIRAVSTESHPIWIESARWEFALRMGEMESHHAFGERAPPKKARRFVSNRPKETPICLTTCFTQLPCRGLI